MWIEGQSMDRLCGRRTFDVEKPDKTQCQYDENIWPSKESHAEEAELQCTETYVFLNDVIKYN